jgi:TonB family protein
MWLSRRKTREKTPLANAPIRVALLSQDSALHDLLQKQVGGGFVIISRPPGQEEGRGVDPACAWGHRCDAILIDLRTGSGFCDSPAGLALMDEIRKAPSHAPMVALCDAEDAEFAREVMRHGAHDKTFAPLKMNELQVILRRAFEFHSAEMKLQEFLSASQARSAQPRQLPRRPLPGTGISSRAVPRPGHSSCPSAKTVVAALVCLTVLAGIVAIRTILAGTPDTLAGNAGLFGTQPANPEQNAGGGPFSLETGLRESSPEDDLTPIASVQPRSETHELRGASTKLNSVTPESRLQLIERTPRSQPAMLIEHLAPRYSRLARQQHLQGTVQVRAIISKDGVPDALSLVSGDPILAQMAFDAISLWRYQPALLDGQPVESEAVITIDFKLPD